MEKDLVKFLNEEKVLPNTGPNAREFFLQLAENEFRKGAITTSIYYQIKSLFQAQIERFTDIMDDDNGNSNGHNNNGISDDNCSGGGGSGSGSGSGGGGDGDGDGDGNNDGGDDEEVNLKNVSWFSVDDLLNGMNSYEKADFPNNPLMQYALAELKKISLSEPPESTNDFLSDTYDPSQGIEEVQNICKQLPSEWTILQLTKGPNCITTYSTYSQLHESDAAIYLTIIKHARSDDYPEPLCLRVDGIVQKDLFKKFGQIRERFRKHIKINENDIKNNNEAKRQYWKLLGELDTFMSESILDLKCFFFPWTFLFNGIPYFVYMTDSQLESLWNKIDKYCDKHNWKSVQSRILLSLAALNANTLTDLQINAIADYLVPGELQQQQNDYLRLLLQREQQIQQKDFNNNSKLYQHLPCLLIVDERLDHFYWEELNPQQEFTRFNSMQSLWTLYNLYKKDIRQGYVNVHVTDGCCLLNPDNNLPKMELRMNSFFDYWLPHWKKMIGQRPTRDELFDVFLCRSCYVYAGHGTGLQYINGRYIAKQNFHCVVFLFGCDSLRMHSNGLYGELNGPHLYYHAAKCPAIVGTLLPALDSHMDTVATDILSRWIAPKSTKVLPWNLIDTISWIKEGHITPSKNLTKPVPSVCSITPCYNMGSLCSVLSRIHQRSGEKKLYNTVPYVCRGLPIWNCHVESLPFD